MATEFFKMSGSGNDFVMLDGRSTSVEAWPAGRIAAVCDRRRGVGGDGLVILTPAGDSAVRMQYFNADGSHAAMCGNAALCSTTLANRLGLVPGPEVTLVTGAGSFPCRATGPDRAELNLPSFGTPVPVDLPLDPGEIGIWRTVVGVPHLVVLVEDVEKQSLMDRGRTLRFHLALAPEGANVNFVGPVSASPGQPGWAMRTYERGVEAETLACGTGAVATGTVLALTGRERLPTRVRSRSGEPLEIRGEIGPDRVESVWLAGQGRLVFIGQLPE